MGAVYTRRKGKRRRPSPLLFAALLAIPVQCVNTAVLWYFLDPGVDTTGVIASVVQGVSLLLQGLAVFGIAIFKTHAPLNAYGMLQLAVGGWLQTTLVLWALMRAGAAVRHRLRRSGAEVVE